MPLDPVLAARLSHLDGVDRWDDPRLESFAVPVREWQRPAIEVDDAGPTEELAVPVRVYRPASVERGSGAMLWVHGGGFVGGGTDMPESDYVASELAARAAVVVVTVDYRLVDVQIRYPLPVNDVLDAWRWLTGNVRPLDADGPVVLGGASAGACLAVSAALRLRDEGDAMPSALLLAYPALHAVLPSLPSDEDEEIDALPPVFRFGAGEVYAMFERYLGTSPADVDDGYAIPALADLHGLPATLIVTSEYDRLRASGETFASALAASGVAVECVREPGTLHGHLNTIGLAGAEASLERLAVFLESLTSRP